MHGRLLLPPSESKTEGGGSTRSPDRFKSQLGGVRGTVLEALASLLETGSPTLLSARFNVRGELLARAMEATHSLVDGVAPLLPAWRRYSGVVWEHLEPASLSSVERRAILVPSALYGMTSAEDVIGDYRLTMGVSLPGTGNLARLWREPLTEIVSKEARRSSIVNLLPQEHASAIDFSRVPNVVHVAFVRGDGKGAAGHVAKSVKGRFARHLIDHGIESAMDFCFDGWSIHEEASGIVLTAVK